MAAVGSSSRTHCLSPSRVRPPVDAAIGPSSYARMFPELPALETAEALLHAIGRAGGLCDCGDLADTPTSLSAVAAGWPIFGQFVAHDITADRSALHSHVNPRALRNARAPQLNLECLYGDGPVGHPFLFQRDDPAKFLLGADGADVPRNVEGIAIIGDPRNDSHMLMAQLHLAMLKAHNAFADRAGSVPTEMYSFHSSLPTRRTVTATVRFVSSTSSIERRIPSHSSPTCSAFDRFHAHERWIGPSCSTRPGVTRRNGQGRSMADWLAP